MKQFKFEGTCCKEISLDVQGGVIKQIDFMGGCPGNLLGLKVLVEGNTVDSVIEKFRGIECGPRPTSCPDQLAKVLKSLQ